VPLPPPAADYCAETNSHNRPPCFRRGLCAEDRRQPAPKDLARFAQWRRRPGHGVRFGRVPAQSALHDMPAIASLARPAYGEKTRTGNKRRRTPLRHRARNPIHREAWEQRVRRATRASSGSCPVSPPNKGDPGMPPAIHRRPRTPPGGHKSSAADSPVLRKLFCQVKENPRKSCRPLGSAGLLALTASIFGRPCHSCYTCRQTVLTIFVRPQLRARVLPQGRRPGELSG